MPNREPAANSSRDLLLVVGVAAFALGGIMTSWSLLPETPGRHPAPPAAPTLAQAGTPARVRAERPAATARAADRDPPRPSGCGATTVFPTFVATCVWRSDPDADQRLALSDMAMWQRGFARERPVGPYRHYVPTRYLAIDRAETSVARADGDTHAGPVSFSRLSR